MEVFIVLVCSSGSGIGYPAEVFFSHEEAEKAIEKRISEQKGFNYFSYKIVPMMVTE